MRVVEHTDLPEDVESLKQLVLRMRQALAHRDLHIEHLKLLLAKLQRARYGRSSERLDERINQLELSIEALEAARVQELPSIDSPEQLKGKPSQALARKSSARDGVTSPGAGRESLPKLRRQAPVPGRGCE